MSSKIKNIIADGAFYLLCLIVACLLNLAVTWLSAKIVNLFVVADFYVSSVTQIICSFITFAAVLGAVSCYDGYKSLNHPIGEKSAALGAAGVVHLGLSMLLMFHPFIAGGTRSLAGIINEGTGFNSADKIPDIYLWQYIFAFLTYFAFNLILINVCGIIGKKSRLANRKKIEGYYDPNEKSGEEKAEEKIE